MKPKFAEDKVINITNFSLPEYRDIPDVGLYLEQVARYINTYLEPLSTNDNDLTITNSMISNYVKHDLIANPVKKMYYRDQIAQLIVISFIKNIISLEDISLMLDELINEYQSVDIYDYFSKKFSSTLAYIFQSGNLPESNNTGGKHLLDLLINGECNEIYLSEVLKKYHQK